MIFYSDKRRVCKRKNYPWRDLLIFYNDLAEDNILNDEDIIDDNELDIIQNDKNDDLER